MRESDGVNRQIRQSRGYKRLHFPVNQGKPLFTDLRSRACRTNGKNTPEYRTEIFGGHFRVNLRFIRLRRLINSHRH